MKKIITTTILLVLVIITIFKFGDQKNNEDDKVSVVSVEREYKNNSVEITNNGNTNLNLTYKKNKITGNTINLPIGSNTELEEGQHDIRVEQT